MKSRFFCAALHVRGRRSRRAALTLVEVMVSMSVLVALVLGFIGSFVHSRRVTEGSVLHAAATSLVYGIIEQLKSVSYTDQLPSTVVDDNAPPSLTPPYVRVRINQNLTQWLRVVYTNGSSSPAAPTETPDLNVSAASLGAIDNVVGPLPLSLTTGTTAQNLTLTLWIWIDERPDPDRGVSDVKQVTLVYTYTYNDGRGTRTVRDREVFLRTRYDQ